MKKEQPYSTTRKGFFLLLYVVSAVALSSTPQEFSDELRLRLADKLQVAQTTSLNWEDVPPLRDFKDALTALNKERDNTPAIRVVIDPGHGGKDLGAQGLYGISEKALSLKISRLLRQDLERVVKLRDLPLRIRLTREEDATLTLSERVRIANEWGADLFVSIHGNSSPIQKAQGFEVYFMSPEASDEDARRLARKENRTLSERGARNDVFSILSDVRSNYHVNESSRFAEDVFSAISLRFRSSGRGVRQAPFTVLAGTSMPSILVEVGYLTHPDEALSLRKFSYLKRLVGAISAGIVDYLLRIKKIG